MRRVSESDAILPEPPFFLLFPRHLLPPSSVRYMPARHNFPIELKKRPRYIRDALSFSV